MDQCNQGQLLPDESIDDGNNTRPTELIPYLLELEQSLMPVLPVIKQKKSKKQNVFFLIYFFSMNRINKNKSCYLSTSFSSIT
jgi:hypothetical protein